VFEDDVSYYQRRAEAELEQAQRAVTPEVVRAHYALATAYLDRVATADLIGQAEDA
jgi:hypothetical protein